MVDIELNSTCGVKTKVAPLNDITDIIQMKE